MQAELGYDAVVTRDGGSVREQLAKVAPDGIDVIVDMVGGEQLAAALEIARHGARCVLLGAVSAELNPHNATLKALVELDTFQLILRGVTMRGFSADEEAPEMFDAWIRQLADWQREGGHSYYPHNGQRPGPGPAGVARSLCGPPQESGTGGAGIVMDTSIASPQVNATAAQSWLLWAGFYLGVAEPAADLHNCRAIAGEPATGLYFHPIGDDLAAGATGHFLHGRRETATMAGRGTCTVFFRADIVKRWL
ncbi:zinc-binding dehydrogenase [Pseudomonas lini]